MDKRKPVPNGDPGNRRDAPQVGAIAAAEAEGRGLQSPASRSQKLNQQLPRGSVPTFPVTRRKSGLGNCFGHWNRLDLNIARQIDPDYLSDIFPGQFQFPMVVIAIRVCPIERQRPGRNFDVVNREGLGKRRVSYDVNRTGGFRIYTVAAHLNVTRKFTFLRAQMQNNNPSSGVDSSPCSYEWPNRRFWWLCLGKSITSPMMSAN